MKGRNIGKALTLISHCVTAWLEDEEFGDAMGAPMGELRHIISKGRARTARRVRRRVKAMTGLKWSAFCREVERRTTPKWVHYHSPHVHFVALVP